MVGFGWPFIFREINMLFNERRVVFMYNTAMELQHELNKNTNQMIDGILELLRDMNDQMKEQSKRISELQEQVEMLNTQISKEA